MTVLNIDMIISAICLIGFVCSFLFLWNDSKEQETINNEYEAYYDKHNSKYYNKCNDQHYMRKYNK